MPKPKRGAKPKLKRLPAEIRRRGRIFLRGELQVIRALAKEYASAGRTKISERVCEAIGWKQPNGWLKDRACRDVLRALDAAKLIRLPPPKVKLHARLYAKWKPVPRIGRSREPMISELPGEISLRLAKGNTEEKLWNRLVQQHHYLGHKVSVGRCIKFLIYAGATVVGAISLAESSWNVEHRDDALRHFGWNRTLVANNSRFLILPHVKVKYLASRSLSLLATEGVRVWNNYYACELKCLETFVDTLRFEGISYKAANWISVGKTKGYRKSGQAFHNSQTPKFIFLYPLQAKKREELRRFHNERIRQS
ncbi:MAG: Druantia anti-phage system protein DruA [Verrucomicrobiota bacterium]